MSSPTASAGRTYADVYRESVERPEEFWLAAATAVEWVEEPTRALDDSSAPMYRWFPDARLNTCFNALDRHVRDGRGDQDALIYDSAMAPEASRTYTYAQLLDEVSRFAGVLAAQGVVAGDRVIVYMPMIPEAAVAMLACARIGAVHSVVFGVSRRRSWRHGSTTPDRLCWSRHRAGSSRGAPSNTCRWWRRRSNCRALHRIR